MLNEVEVLQTLVNKIANVDLTAQQIALWQPIEQHRNHLYKIQFGNEQWIAKAFSKPDEFDDAPRREFAAMQLLAPYDIAPQPIHYEKHDGDQQPIVLYEFMPGEMWDRYTPTAEELQHLAHLWLTMHTAPTADLWLSRGMEQTASQIVERFATHFQHYANWTAAHFPAGQQSAAYLQQVAEKCSTIIDRLFQMKPVLCFSRADPRFANVIRRPDQRLGMIDWEDSGLRDPARDVADIVSHPNQEDLLTWAEWQPFFEPYLAERRKVDPEIEQRVHLYHAIYPLFWLSGLVRYGIRLWETDQIENWNINTMNPNERLRRYLARAMAWPKIDFEYELDAVAEMVFFEIGAGKR